MSDKVKDGGCGEPYNLEVWELRQCLLPLPSNSRTPASSRELCILGNSARA